MEQSVQSFEAASDLSNTSGQGKTSIIPPEIDKWNWGSFSFTWVWGIYHGVYYFPFLAVLAGIGIRLSLMLTGTIRLVLLSLFIITELVVILICGRFGNKWAWQNKKWPSLEIFQERQKLWSSSGLVFAIFSLFATLIYVFMILSILNSLSKQTDQPVSSLFYGFILSKPIPPWQTTLVSDFPKELILDDSAKLVKSAYFKNTKEYSAEFDSGKSSGDIAKLYTDYFNNSGYYISNNSQGDYGHRSIFADSYKKNMWVSVQIFPSTQTLGVQTSEGKIHINIAPLIADNFPKQFLLDSSAIVPELPYYLQQDSESPSYLLLFKSSLSDQEIYDLYFNYLVHNGFAPDAELSPDKHPTDWSIRAKNNSYDITLFKNSDLNLIQLHINVIKSTSTSPMGSQKNSSSISFPPY
jgi:hypothetical protein